CTDQRSGYCTDHREARASHQQASGSVPDLLRDARELDEELFERRVVLVVVEDWLADFQRVDLRFDVSALPLECCEFPVARWSRRARIAIDLQRELAVLTRSLRLAR